MNKRCVCGLDPSLRGFGAVSLSASGEHDSEVFVSSSGGVSLEPRISRASSMTAAVVEWVAERKPQVVCLEGYAFGANQRSTTWLAELGGLLRCELLVVGVHLIEVAPTRLKKFTTGRGNADKLAVATSCVSRWGVEFECSDLFDAYALARMAGVVAGYWEPANDAQRVAIAAMLGDQRK